MTLCVGLHGARYATFNLLENFQIPLVGGKSCVRVKLKKIQEGALAHGIDLFSLHVLFSISDHVMFSMEFFCFLTIYSYISTCIRRHLKEGVLLSNITWSEMAKQNVQAKEVIFLDSYSNTISESW